MTLTSLTPLAPPGCAGTLRIEVWSDPVVEEHGFDPRCWYVETFWLGILGPSTTWLLRLLAAGLDREPEGFELDLDEAARMLGLGGKAGRHSPFQRALARSVTFGMARTHPDGALAVRRMLPPLARRHLLRLPAGVQERHREWTRTLHPAGRDGPPGGTEGERPIAPPRPEPADGAIRTSLRPGPA